MPVHGGRFREVFNDQQQQELQQYLKDMDRRLFGMTKKQCRKLAFDYAESCGIVHPFNRECGLAGEEWLANFMKKFHFSLRTPEATSIGRMMGFNKVQVEMFFEVLRDVRQKYSFPANNIYNADESGLSTVPTKLPKVISPVGNKRVSKVVSTERGRNITIICCMSATGLYVPPFLIFPRKRMRAELLENAPPGSVGYGSDNGWVNTELFLAFLQHFAKHVKPTAETPVLLLVDNHSSHITLLAINFCRDNNIIMLGFPPHTTHRLQPLDVAFFGPLKTFFSQASDNFSVSHPGQGITDYNIGELLSTAYFKAATVGNAVKGFRACGIEPFNPQVFGDEDFAPAATTERSFHEIMDPQHNITDPPQTSASSQNTEPSQQIVTSEPGPSNRPQFSLANHKSIYDVKPLPNATRGKRNRQVKCATIITSTPVKIKLMEKEKEKEEKQKRKVERAAKKSAKKLKFEVSKPHPEEKDIFCPGCDELYCDPPNEDWIQCSACHEWWHETCSNYEGGRFICDYC